MTIERRMNPSSGVVELWWCEEERKVADEQPLVSEFGSAHDEEVAICWAYGRTLGNICVRSPDRQNYFSAQRGENVILPCDFVHAGKYRHGADRWWCRTHQSHWGIKADILALQASGVFHCSVSDQAMNYVVDPFTVDLRGHAEVGIWCSLPAALSTAEIKPRAPKIHVHVRDAAESEKRIDRDFAAVSAVYPTEGELFSNGGVVRVDITPPAAFDFVCALEAGKVLGCINCPRCGHPHLDLGDFGKTPHRKHFCANCGRDSTWSKSPIISTPLQPLHDRYSSHVAYMVPDRSLNLDDFKGCSYTIWASTPAIVWTAARPQEYGIHVHVHQGTERIVDETFGEVILDGTTLVRSALLDMMIERAMV